VKEPRDRIRYRTQGLLVPDREREREKERGWGRERERQRETNEGRAKVGTWSSGFSSPLSLSTDRGEKLKST